MAKDEVLRYVTMGSKMTTRGARMIVLEVLMAGAVQEGRVL